MAREKSPADQAQTEEMKKTAASAAEETLSQSMRETLLKIRLEDLIESNPESEIIKGNALRSSAWLHGPAHLQLLAVADRRLTRAAELAGQSVKKVEQVHARLVKGTKLLILTSAPATDLTAVPVNRYSGNAGAWINLITLLGEAGLTVETGYRERFTVAYVPQGSPLWPGLVIDLGQPTERSKIRPRKSAHP